MHMCPVYTCNKRKAEKNNHFCHKVWQTGTPPPPTISTASKIFFVYIRTFASNWLGDRIVWRARCVTKVLAHIKLFNSQSWQFYWCFDILHKNYIKFHPRARAYICLYICGALCTRMSHLEKIQHFFLSKSHIYTTASSLALRLFTIARCEF